jgi:LacI family transcriptional regulator
VPHDVSVVGFNNEEIAVLTAPSITTIDAEVAASPPPPSRSCSSSCAPGKRDRYTRLLPPRLVIRESTGPARAIEQ